MWIEDASICSKPPPALNCYMVCLKCSPYLYYGEQSKNITFLLYLQANLHIDLRCFRFLFHRRTGRAVRLDIFRPGGDGTGTDSGTVTLSIEPL